MYELFLDIGNTSIAIGLYEDNNLKATGRMPSDTSLEVSTYEDLLTTFLTKHDLTMTDINELVIASVVPDLTNAFTQLWQQQKEKEPFIVHAGLTSNLQIALEEPTELGSDLLAGAVAAHEAYPNTNAIIVDMGTATTMMIITKEGAFRGGSIVTGLELMGRALIDNTALLSFDETLERDDIKAIGTSTKTAIESGLVYGYTGLVDNIISSMLAELATDDYKIITTGGQAPLIAKSSKYLDNYEPNLIFKGMRIIYDMNK